MSNYNFFEQVSKPENSAVRFPSVSLPLSPVDRDTAILINGMAQLLPHLNIGEKLATLQSAAFWLLLAERLQIGEEVKSEEIPDEKE